MRDASTHSSLSPIYCTRHVAGAGKPDLSPLNVLAGGGSGAGLLGVTMWIYFVPDLMAASLSNTRELRTSAPLRPPSLPQPVLCHLHPPTHRLTRVGNGGRRRR